MTSEKAVSAYTNPIFSDSMYGRDRYDYIPIFDAVQRMLLGLSKDKKCDLQMDSDYNSKPTSADLDPN